MYEICSDFVKQVESFVCISFPEPMSGILGFFVISRAGFIFWSKHDRSPFLGGCPCKEGMKKDTARLCDLIPPRFPSKTSGSGAAEAVTSAFISPARPWSSFPHYCAWSAHELMEPRGGVFASAVWSQASDLYLQ